MKRIIKFIPDFITSMNLVCGIVGVVFTFKGRFDIAFPLMLAAAVFDFCDGLAARALDAYSDLGRELDSLCDMVSFGVLPSVMLYQLMRICTYSESVLCYVPLFIAVFSGLRLAKFNVDERQHENFLGMATPIGAILCGSLAYFVAYEPDSFLSAWASGLVFIPLLSVILCALLVCEIPMFSMKFKRGQDKVLLRKRIYFAINVLLIVGIVVALGLNWSLVGLLTSVFYVFMNVVYALFKI
ncbi:MAG: CDP-diacylglycerol--serine O-phosphatidyltransferase [Bacteroidales bacterium]|nr:CDP-diacylglycerol--serine O-phosphatidyltransferase [Bacteroidales bacterium]